MKHATLDTLPRHLRAQAAAQIGVPAPSVPAATRAKRPSSTASTASSLSPPPTKPAAPKMTATEEEFLLQWRRTIGLQTTERLRFEPLTLHLNGGNYTPDFGYYDHLHDCYVCYEIKGDYKLQSHARALLAFREARAQYKFITFRWFEKMKGKNSGFTEKYPPEYRPARDL